MKALVVSLLEPALSLFVVVQTLLGILSGWFIGGLVGGGLFRLGTLNLGSIIGAVLGGGAAFSAAVIATGIAFTLLAIKDRLEEQIDLLAETNELLSQEHISGVERG